MLVGSAPDGAVAPVDPIRMCADPFAGLPPLPLLPPPHAEATVIKKPTIKASLASNLKS